MARPGPCSFRTQGALPQGRDGPPNPSGANPGVKIAASILAADLGRLAEEIHAAERGGVDRVHVDVMDGRFVLNLTFGAVLVEAVRRATRLPVDVHLMVVEPERLLEDFVRAGADRICVHVEATPHLHRVLRTIRALGASPGVALNPATPPETVEWVLQELDSVVVMTVNPGFSGQEFIPEALPKVRWFRQRILSGGLRTEVEVDGGINEATAPLAVRAGATVVVAASAVFRSPEGATRAVSRLRDAIRTAAPATPAPHSAPGL